MKIVPDTSALIDGHVSTYTDTTTDDSLTIVIPEAVVSELEAQANDGTQTGWDGLDELQTLATIADTTDHSIEYTGTALSPSDSQNAHKGDVDALIRNIAEEHNATLMTSDTVQADIAQAKNIPVEQVEPTVRTTDTLTIEQFFDDTTMSVHLKTDTYPKAKRGSIGDMVYEQIAEDPVTHTQMRTWADEIETASTERHDSFVELSHPGMSIVQFNDYRIAIARPPFSDDIEITAVKPIVKTTLDDYNSAGELRDRLSEQQRGVLISGAPGAGKSTFAQAVAEFLNDNNYSVKTMENPRDLQVGADITQYGPLGGDMANTADSLLLVRPDYTIYDEVRKTDDFEVFADMRLAGVGMLGVVHATRAIDALQRLVGRVELGMIPQIVDTVVYIEAGDVHTVYDVTTEVKVPAGMQAEDLARPVIQVVDLEANTPQFEIYTFNRQVVTVPLDDVDDTNTDSELSGVSGLARTKIEREFHSLTHGPVDVDVTGEHTATVYVPATDMSQIIGKNGQQIDQIESTLGLSIDVQPHDNAPTTQTQSPTQAPDTAQTPITPEITDSNISFSLNRHKGETVELYAGNSYLFTATVGKDGTINLGRGNAIANEIETAIDNNRQITIES